MGAMSAVCLYVFNILLGKNATVSCKVECRFIKSLIPLGVEK